MIPKRVMHEMIKKYGFAGVAVNSRIGCDPQAHIKREVEAGREVPEDLRPGYLLRHASQDELNALKGLKSDDLKNDWPELWLPA